MTNSNRLILAVGLLLACGFLLLIVGLAAGVMRLTAHGTPTPDVVGTFQAMVATGAPISPPEVSPVPSQFAPTQAPSTPLASAQPGALDGHIAFTCQIYKYQSSEQICLMNPDGSGWRRLTTDDGNRHFYPSLSPDGKSVVYSQYREDNVYEIYELNIASGKATPLTDKLGALNGPEISPDGNYIVFKRWSVASNQEQVWLMDRDGSKPHRLFNGTGWDPTWSPDGTKVLFASDRDGATQLYVGNVDGSQVHKISDLPSIRGRSDWSVLDQITTYSGDSWAREIFLMNADGSNEHRVSPRGGNSQGPSFSPDGQWIAFTAYFDHFKDDNGCEIYIMRLDGTDLRRLTNNDYCDYQPRWGP